MSEPLILALDCATRSVGVALCSRQQVLARTTLPAGNSHTAPTAALAATVQAVLAAASVGAHQVQLIAIPQGPGSFNGLRSTFAFAKGFALRWGCALAAIPTLAIAVQPLPTAPPYATAVLPAGRGRVAVQSFYWHAAQASWQPNDTGRICPLDALWAALPEQPGQLTGELLPADYATLATHCPSHVRLATFGERSLLVLAQLAYAHWQRGGDCNPLAAQAVYWQQPT